MEKQKKTTVEKDHSLRLSVNAIVNINEITGYIAFINNQPQNAVKVGDAFYKIFEKIQRNPFAFRECEYLKTKTKIYRRAVCLAWIIIYKISGKDIIILGIIHGSRNPVVLKNLKHIKF